MLTYLLKGTLWSTFPLNETNLALFPHSPRLLKARAFVKGEGSRRLGLKGRRRAFRYPNIPQSDGCLAKIRIGAPPIRIRIH